MPHAALAVQHLRRLVQVIDVTVIMPIMIYHTIVLHFREHHDGRRVSAEGRLNWSFTSRSERPASLVPSQERADHIS